MDYRRDSNNPVVAWLFGWEHKSKFPENRQLDPHSACYCRDPHRSEPVGDHLTPLFVENKRQPDKLPLQKQSTPANFPRNNTTVG